jgi:hypothetical protein
MIMSSEEYPTVTPLYPLPERAMDRFRKRGRYDGAARLRRVAPASDILRFRF